MIILRKHISLYCAVMLIILSMFVVLLYRKSVSSTEESKYTMEDIEEYLKRNDVQIIRNSTNSLSINHRYGEQYSIKYAKAYEFEFYVYDSDKQREKARKEFVYKTQNLDLKCCKLYEIKNILAILEGVNTKDYMYKRIDSLIGKME